MRISSFVRRYSILSCVFLVGACAYSTKASFQDITFLSPDAQDAKCLVYAAGVKYQVWPPQTVNIKKSSKPMLIECSAPGNRVIEVEVSPKIETVAVWGTPVGMAWDYASQSLYSYPEVIAIDFSQEKLKPFPLPKHNNKDIRQPESYDLEEFLPSEPRLNSDRGRKATLLKRRGEEEAPAVVDKKGDDASLSVEEGVQELQKDQKEPVIQQDVSKDVVKVTKEPAVEKTNKVVEISTDKVVSEPDQLVSGAKAANDGILTPMVGEKSVEPMADNPVVNASSSQSSEADSAPVPLVPGE